MRKITLLLFTIFLLGQTACKKDKKEEIILDPSVPTISKIVAGRYHTFLIKSDNTLYACGLNDNHQIDLNTGLFSGNQDTFIKVKDSILDAAAGLEHSLILKTDNSLWICGRNTYGQLGRELPPPLISFRKLYDNVLKVASLYEHTLILKKDGTVWASGLNSFGQLGIGTLDNSSEFIQIASNAKDIAVGNYNSFVIKNDNTLWGCGYNIYGQVGDGTTVNKTSLVQVNTNVSQVACGVTHTLIIKNGTAFGIGSNSSNQLGDIVILDRSWKELKTRISSVQAGIYSSFLISKGNAYISGKNSNGYFGLSDVFADDIKPDFGTTPDLLFDKIFVGYYTSFIIVNGKYLMASGANTNGQLGIGSNGDDISNFVYVRGFEDPDAR